MLCAKQHNQPLYQYGTKDGLPSERIYWATQDQKGYMWFATQAGVCRYDGYHSNVITTHQGLSHNVVRQLYLDASQRMWMRTQNGLTRQEGNTYIRLDSLKRVSPQPITSLAQWREDEFWITTSLAFHVVVADTVQSTKRFSRMGLSPNAKIVSESSTSILLADRQQLLRLGKNQQIIQRIPLQYKPSSTDGIPVLCALAEGGYLMAAEEGLIRISPDGHQKLLLSVKQFPSWGEVRSLITDEYGDIWIALAQGGVLWLSPQGDSYRLIDQILANESIWHLFEDREGNLWITTDNSGVWLFTAGAKRLYHYNLVEHARLQRLINDTPARLVDIDVDQNDQLWLAWENGTLAQIPSLDAIDKANYIRLQSSLAPNTSIRK
ncbi:MAG: two-component regulator propeller domain-containing protein, partial [Bacteroidota bacterium]